MPFFKDNNDREWSINLDAPLIDIIRGDCDPRFMLNDSEEDSTYGRLQVDPYLLCRVIFLLTKDERVQRNVADKDFYASLKGDAIDRATDALLQAILGFTPKRTREMLRTFAEQSQLAQEMATEQALAILRNPRFVELAANELTAEMRRKFQELMQQTSATDAAGSSDSPLKEEP
jgi:hypothetical protein